MAAHIHPTSPAAIVLWLWSRAIINSSRTIDKKRERIYPVAEWRKEDVVAYIRQNKLKG